MVSAVEFAFETENKLHYYFSHWDPVAGSEIGILRPSADHFQANHPPPPGDSQTARPPQKNNTILLLVEVLIPV